jgi:hypothetical protein
MFGINSVASYLHFDEFLQPTFALYSFCDTQDSVFLRRASGLPFLHQIGLKDFEFPSFFPGKDCRGTKDPVLLGVWAFPFLCIIHSTDLPLVGELSYVSWNGTCSMAFCDADRSTHQPSGPKRLPTHQLIASIAQFPRS